MPALLQSRLTRALTSDRTDQNAAASRGCLRPANSDLAEALRSGALRRELYDVLSVITLRLPPLRERRGRHPAAGPALHPAPERRAQPHDPRHGRSGAAPAAGAPLAGQRRRARARGQARLHRRARRRDHDATRSPTRLTDSRFDREDVEIRAVAGDADRAARAARRSHRRCDRRRRFTTSSSWSSRHWCARR